MDFIPQNGLLWIDRLYWGNSARAWLIALAIVASSYAILLALRNLLGDYLKKLAQRTPTDIDDFLASLLRSLHPLVILCVSIWLAVAVLRLPAPIHKLVQTLPWAGPLLQLGFWTRRFTEFMAGRYLASRASEPERLTAQTMMGPAQVIATMLLWVLLLAIALQNMGMNVTALITGLGVGGIAVALAVQNILRDALSAFSIVMDKPFIVGDFIQIDNFSGVVQHIGMKTTRLTSVGGEQLIFPNSNLLSGRIRNFGRLVNRRVVIQLTLEHDVALEALAQAPTMARETVEAQDDVRFDRAHICAFTLAGRTLEVVYFVTTADYNRHMDILQAVHLELARRFHDAGIPLAKAPSAAPAGA